MANNDFFKIKKGVKLEPTTTAPSENGAMVYDSDNNTVNYYNGAERQITNLNEAQTLTNKTLTTPTLTTPRLPEVGTPSTPASGFGNIYFKADGFLYQLNAAGAETKVGSGAAGINYITTPDAESGVGAWDNYDNATPLNIPDGTITGTHNALTFTAATDTTLRGTKLFQIAQADSTSAQGEGVNHAFTIDEADKATVLNISFSFNASSTFIASDGITAPLNDGTTSTNAGNSDVEVFMWDVTAAALIPVSPQVFAAKGANNFKFTGTFQTSTGTAGNNINYILFIHVASTSANATGWTLKFDDVRVGPQSTLLASPVNDWIAYTPTFIGFGTVTSETGFYRRVGDSIEVNAFWTTGTVTATRATISLPPGLNMDAGKLNQNNVGSAPGDIIGIYGQNVGTTATRIGHMLSAPSEGAGFAYFGTDFASAPKLVTQAANAIFTDAAVTSCRFTTPILGWGSSVVMSNDTDTRVVAALYETTDAHTITNAASTTDEFPCEIKLFDTHNAYDITTSLYTCPVSGLYECKGMVRMAGTGNWNIDEALQLVLFKNAGSSDRHIAINRAQADSANVMVTGGVGLIQCVAGDTLEIRVFQNTGGTLDTVAGAATQNWVSYQRLSGPATIAPTESVNALYETTTGTSISNNSTITKQFLLDTKVFDSHNAFNLTDNTFDVPISGVYRVTFSAALTGDAGWEVNELFRGELYKNTVRERLMGTLPCMETTTIVMRVSGSTLVKCVAGDNLEVRLLQNSDGAITLNGDANDNWASYERIGN